MSAAGGFVEWAKKSELARFGFRGAMGAARVGTGVLPGLPSTLLDQASRRRYRPVKPTDCPPGASLPLRPGADLVPAEQLVVEGAYPLGVLRHLELHGVVRPGRLAQERRHEERKERQTATG